MNDERPIPTQRDITERNALLRSTNELPEHLCADLDDALARDAEAAEFSNFVANELPLAAKAPRDFAAAALDSMLSAPKDFAAAAIESALPTSRKKSPLLRLLPRYAAAAAAVMLAAFFAKRQWPQPAVSGTTPSESVIVTPTREREMISTDLAALEKEIFQASARLSRSRYQRTTL